MAACRAALLEGKALAAYAMSKTLQSQAADPFGKGDAQGNADQMLVLEYSLLGERRGQPVHRERVRGGLVLQDESGAAFAAAQAAAEAGDAFDLAAVALAEEGASGISG